jgi:GTP diphosphokinase / guanosine-3',5'-bis(diphosphate) 3'-diphosphatase
LVRINEIIDRLQSYEPKAEIELIQKAYIWSARLHRNQLRASGLPYLSHPLEVAWTLTELKANEPTIAAGLLHDTIEDCNITKEELAKAFGEEIASLVDGVTRVGQISMATKPEIQAEYLGKMILAMAKDIRVVLIKLADRLHNMRTLDFLAKEKQVETAEETIQIYAPIAHRLGIYWVKTELEDLSFKYLKPEIFSRLKDEVEKIASRRQDYITRVQSILKDKLGEAGVDSEVQGRLKHLYSIYYKMEQEKLSLAEITDIYGFRILVKTIRECYEALYVIHSFWAPVPGKIKDYIALPKPNLYQSLHTTVIGPEGERIEIQIRTYEMHKVAEQGIAAHWRYKKESGLAEAGSEEQFDWLKRLVEFKEELSNPHQFLETVKSDLFPDEVYVFTPKGELKVFPKGATPIDFAYSIHTDLGNRCAGAKVNNRIVPLSFKMESGDIVEIITSKETHPVKAWLDLAVTARAKTKIQHFIHGQEVKKSWELGLEILENELLKFNISVHDLIKSGQLDEIARKYRFTEYKKLLEAIGFGKFSHRKVLAAVLPADQLRRIAPAKTKKTKPEVSEVMMPRPAKEKKPQGIVVKGADEPLLMFDPACQPLPGEEVVAYLMADSGLILHRSSCPKILELDADKIIPATWSKRVKGNFMATIEVISGDQKGLLSKMSGAISEIGANITRAVVKTRDDQKAVATFELEVKSARDLNQIINKLERIKNVIRVQRISGAA